MAVMTLPIYLTILAVIAFTAAIMGVLGIFTASHWIKRFGVLGTFIWLAAAASVINVVGSTREFGIDHVSALYYMTPFSFWSSRVFSLTFVSLAVLAILMAIGKQRKHQGGYALWLMYTAFFFSVVACSVFGAKPSFTHQIVYMWLVMTAIYVSPAIRPEQIATHAKYAAAIILYGSLILAPIQPSLYVESGYAGIVPGFNIRLHGLANHANNLGPLALFYLLLEYWVPSAKPWNRLSIVVALTVLILAQSKTAWIMSVSAVLAILILRLIVKFKHEWKHSKSSMATIGFVSVFVLMPIVAVSIFSSETLSFQRVFGTGEQVRTLTGRTEIWEITLETWKKNPWFGYGPTLWDLDFRMRYGQLAAIHAHNQFIQTLGESGLIGLAALLLYVGALVGYALKFSVRTKGVSIALVLMLLIRSMTEVPFRLFMSLDAAFLIHLTIFAILIMLARSARDDPKIMSAQHWQDNLAANLRK